MITKPYTCVKLLVIMIYINITNATRCVFLYDIELLLRMIIGLKVLKIFEIFKVF